MTVTAVVDIEEYVCVVVDVAKAETEESFVHTNVTDVTVLDVVETYFGILNVPPEINRTKGLDPDRDSTLDL